MLLVEGKGSKERRVALRNNCLRNLLYYLDKQRPDPAILIGQTSNFSLR